MVAKAWKERRRTRTIVDMSPRRVDEPLRWSAVSRTVVDQVHAALGFEWVAVTRKRDDDMVLLQVHDDGYGLAAGDVSKWADSFCARAFDGRGPRVTPDVSQEPEYVALIAQLGLDVAAHVSVPLRGDDGVVLGSLCALSRSTRSEDLRAQAPMLEAFAGLLGALLSAELRLQEQVRRTERALPDGHGDQLTGLGNRRDWERRLGAEERRCAAYGLEAGLLAVEVRGLRGLNETGGHGAGDARLCEASAVLCDVAGGDSVLARVGGDQFAVLLPDADLSRLYVVEDDLRRALRAHGIAAAVGTAARGRTGAGGAWHRAVERMRADQVPVRRRAAARSGVGREGRRGGHEPGRRAARGRAAGAGPPPARRHDRLRRTVGG